MVNEERMFDVDSFQEEITKPSEALSCYNYFASNLPKFRQELSEEGLSSAEAEGIVKQCWLNLAESSARVGWSNRHLVEIAKRYGQDSRNTRK